MKRKKTSKFRGVCWSEPKKRWKVEIRSAGIQILCETELEAAMLYNAAARKIWGQVKTNPTPLAGQIDFVLPNVGRAFWLAGGKYALVDQHETELTPVTYRQLMNYEWFYRKGFAYWAEYNPTDKKFILHGMHEMVFRGRCYHRNRNTLDNRRANLRPLVETEDLPINPLDPATLAQLLKPDP